MAASTTAPSLYLLPFLPTRTHKFFPIIRWKYPLSLGPKALPHEFFFYAARRSDTPLTIPARRVLKFLGLNRALLLLQAFIWGPLYLGAWDLGTGSAKVPGTDIKLPLPDIKGLKREEWETVWGALKEKARRRVEVERVDQEGVLRREYYDPCPRSIVGRSFTDRYEYLGEVW